MVTLKHIDVVSTAKISAVLDAIVGLIVGIIVFVFAGAFSSVFGRSYAMFPFATIGLVSVIAIPIALLVFGFIFVAVISWLYNVLADRMGGIRLTLAQNRLQSLDVVSTAKMYGVLAAIVGFIIGIIVAIVGFAIPFVGAWGIAAIVILPIFFGIVAFVGVAILTLIYNFLASRIGGVVLVFKKNELVSVGPMSYAKVEAVFGAIFGLLAGIRYAIVPIGGTTVPTLTHSLGAWSIIVYPILYFITSFVAALFAGWLYNALASKIGGAKITLA